MQREKKWTTGPWGVWGEPVETRADAAVELENLAHGTPNFCGTLYILCTLQGLAPAVTGCGKDSEANAALIAAAPELVDNGELVADWLRAALECKEFKWDLDQYEAAKGCLADFDKSIGKAYGE